MDSRRVGAARRIRDERGAPTEVLTNRFIRLIRVAECSNHPQLETKNETTRTTQVIDTRRIGSSVSPTENATPWRNSAGPIVGHLSPHILCATLSIQ